MRNCIRVPPTRSLPKAVSETCGYSAEVVGKSDEWREIHLHDGDGIIVKYCGYIFGGKFVGGVTN